MKKHLMKANPNQTTNNENDVVMVQAQPIANQNPNSNPNPNNSSIANPNPIPSNQSSGLKLPSSYKRKAAAQTAAQTASTSTNENLSEQQLVASHYNKLPMKTLGERNQSEIIGLRNFNNWIKSVMINQYIKPGNNVLDLACGKGGDLLKLQFSQINRLVGVDIAKKSLEEAINRYNSSEILKYSIRVICADCTQFNFIKHLGENEWFDNAMCQFALHYSFQSEKTARTFLSNLVSRVKPGGAVLITIPDANLIVKKLRESSSLEFGNSVYKIKFSTNNFPKESNGFGHRYEFNLVDAIDECPEYLVPTKNFIDLASQPEFNLSLELEMNFHQFYDLKIKDPNYYSMFDKMVKRKSFISNNEWEAIGLYKVIIFRKNPNPNFKAPSIISQGTEKPIKIDDILVIN